MNAVFRVVTRIQDQDDFSGSLTDGQFLKYNSSTNSFELQSVSPGGDSGQLQYNNSGSFAGVNHSSIGISGDIFKLNSLAIGDIPLVIKGFSGQVGNLTEWRDESNNVIASISPSGSFVTGPITASGDLDLGNYQLLAKKVSLQASIDAINLTSGLHLSNNSGIQYYANHLETFVDGTIRTIIDNQSNFRIPSDNGFGIASDVDNLTGADVKLIRNSTGPAFEIRANSGLNIKNFTGNANAALTCGAITTSGPLAVGVVKQLDAGFGTQWRQVSNDAFLMTFSLSQGFLISNSYGGGFAASADVAPDVRWSRSATGPRLLSRAAGGFASRTLADDADAPITGSTFTASGAVTASYFYGGIRSATAFTSNWATAYQIRVHPSAYIGWDSVSEIGNDVDIQLNRKSLGKLAVRGDNGLCVRNLADSADAPITCSAITASGNLSVSGVIIAPLGMIATANNSTGIQVLAASLIPATGNGYAYNDNAYDLGISASRWRDLRIGRDAYIGGAITASGAVTMNNDVTFKVTGSSTVIGTVTGSTGLLTWNFPANFGLSVTAGTLNVNGRILSNSTESNTANPGGNIGDLIGNNGYWAIRSSTTHSFNLDMFNAGSSITPLSVSQSGAITVSGNVIFGSSALLKISSGRLVVRSAADTGYYGFMAQEVLVPAAGTFQFSGNAYMESAADTIVMKNWAGSAGAALTCGAITASGAYTGTTANFVGAGSVVRIQRSGMNDTTLGDDSGVAFAIRNNGDSSLMMTINNSTKLATFYGAITASGLITANVGINIATGYVLQIGPNVYMSRGSGSTVDLNSDAGVRVRNYANSADAALACGAITSGAITSSGNLNLTGTYPYFGLSSSGWSGGTFYFQTGVDDTGTGTGNFTGLLNPVSKSFTIISGNPNTTGRKHLTIDGTTSAAVFSGPVTLPDGSNASPSLVWSNGFGLYKAALGISFKGGFEIFHSGVRAGYWQWDGISVRSDAAIGFSPTTATQQGGGGDAYFVRNSASSIGVKGASGIDGAITCGAITASGTVSCPQINGIGTGYSVGVFGPSADLSSGYRNLDINAPTGLPVLQFKTNGTLRAQHYWASNVFNIYSAGNHALTSSSATQMLGFGGLMVGTPALKRVLNTLQVRLGDDSNFADLTTGAITASGIVRAGSQTGDYTAIEYYGSTYKTAVLSGYGLTHYADVHSFRGASGAPGVVRFIGMGVMLGAVNTTGSDIGLIRSSPTVLDIQANGGLRVRNFADSADAALTCGAINTSQHLEASLYLISNQGRVFARANGSAGFLLGASDDCNMSRISAGVIGFGTGAAGSTAAEIRCSAITASGPVKATSFPDRNTLTFGWTDNSGDAGMSGYAGQNRLHFLTASTARLGISQSGQVALPGALGIGTSMSNFSGGAWLQSGGDEILQQRNSTLAQCFQLHKTYTSSVDREWLDFKATGSTYEISSAIGSAGGSNRSINIGHRNSVGTFTSVLNVNTTGEVDVTSIYAITAYMGFRNKTTFVCNTDGILALTNWAGTNFTRLQLGGMTASFPAIKRSGTTTAFRLADDSADGPITCAAITASGQATFDTGTDFPVRLSRGGTVAAYLGSNSTRDFILCDSAGIPALTILTTSSSASKAATFAGAITASEAVGIRTSPVSPLHVKESVNNYTGGITLENTNGWRSTLWNGTGALVFDSGASISEIWLQTSSVTRTAVSSTGLSVTGAITASGQIIETPPASVTLGTNGQFSIEMTSDTAGNLVYRGSDGITRRMALSFV